MIDTRIWGDRSINKDFIEKAWRPELRSLAQGHDYNLKRREKVTRGSLELIGHLDQSVSSWFIERLCLKNNQVKNKRGRYSILTCILHMHAQPTLTIKRAYNTSHKHAHGHTLKRRTDICLVHVWTWYEDVARKMANSQFKELSVDARSHTQEWLIPWGHWFNPDRVWQQSTVPRERQRLSSAQKSREICFKALGRGDGSLVLWKQGLLHLRDCGQGMEEIKFS